MRKRHGRAETRRTFSVQAAECKSTNSDQRFALHAGDMSTSASEFGMRRTAAIAQNYRRKLPAKVSSHAGAPMQAKSKGKQPNSGMQAGQLSVSMKSHAKRKPTDRQTIYTCMGTVLGLTDASVQASVTGRASDRTCYCGAAAGAQGGAGSPWNHIEA